MQIFARITKVDEATRSVSGIIANEALDRSGEVFDYESSKPHFDKWSTDIAKATDGKSVGNVRAMHGNVAAGKLTALNMDDAAKAITVDAKVVDDNEWAKVQQGVYTGFSIGGKYAKQWTQDGVKRYTAQPFEVSLVDLPCNPDAQFTVIKADGSEELRKFVTEPAKDEKDESEIAKAEHAAQLVKAADDLAKVSADLAKANDDLAKAADDLAKLTTERDDALAKLKASQDEIETLKQSAAAPKGAVRVVEKIEDNGGSLAKIDESPVLASDGSIDHVATAMKLMKVAHTRPMAGIR